MLDQASDISASGSIEDREDLSRVEAFSDGVIAIIITIMVLDIRAPRDSGLDRLLMLWPTYLAYVISYGYVAIYWINHHKLFKYARFVSLRLLLANFALLFSMSFIPVAASYLGNQQFSRDATLVYLVVLLHPALAHLWLLSVVRRGAHPDGNATRFHRMAFGKNMAALAIYGLAIVLTFWHATIGVLLAGSVALVWLVPWSRPGSPDFAIQNNEGA